jgi:hypothetical protein
MPEVRLAVEPLEGMPAVIDRRSRQSWWERGSLQMAKIKFEIDSHDGDVNNLSRNPEITKGGGFRQFLAPAQAPTQLGILDPFEVTPKMLAAITSGWGSTSTPLVKDKVGRNPGDLRNAINELISGGCDVIATLGGLIVHDAIAGSTSVPFFVMAGSNPLGTSTNRFGGVSLQSRETNSDRRAFLTSTIGVANVSRIGLYRDGNLQGRIGAAERLEWTSANPPVGGVSRIIESPALNFAADLNGGAGVTIVPPDIQALVISSSPTFQAQKNALVAAANTWVAGNTGGQPRHVVYPLQIYGEATPRPTGPNRNTLFGPDLYQAGSLLGFMASLGVQCGFRNAQIIQTRI